MARVDEPLQAVRAAVGLVHRPQATPRRSPSRAARERGDRHQLDQVDAELAQVVQPFDGRVEGALRGEGADVQLVEDRPGSGGPARRRTRRSRRGHDRARPVRPVGLPPRPRVGQRRAAVQAEGVVGPAGAARRRVPPAVVGRPHRVPSPATHLDRPAAGAQTRDGVSRPTRCGTGAAGRPHRVARASTPGSRGQLSGGSAVQGTRSARRATALGQRQHRVRPAAPPPQTVGQPGGGGTTGPRTAADVRPRRTTVPRRASDQRLVVGEPVGQLAAQAQGAGVTSSFSSSRSRGRRAVVSVASTRRPS